MLANFPQISSYDATADDDELPLIATPCVRALIDLAGVTLGQRRKMVIQRREKKKPNDHTTTMRATTTPLVHDIFNRIFGTILDDSAAVTKVCDKGRRIVEAFDRFLFFEWY